MRAGDDTVVVSWLPQYHDMGLIGSYLGAMYCGGCGVYMSPISFIKRPGLWIEARRARGCAAQGPVRVCVVRVAGVGAHARALAQAISQHRGTHIQAPNFAYKLVARKFDPAGEWRASLACSNADNSESNVWL